MSKTADFKKESLFILLIILFAGIVGILYAFLIPPWQHYDEPNHFEYVWLVANLEELPAEDAYSPKASRQIFRSMLVNGFFDGQTELPIIPPPGENIYLPGYSQLTEPPIYYLLASIPVRLLSSRSIDAQLYGARLVSVMFLLVTVLVSWGISVELTPPGHVLRMMLPLTTALTPAFIDLMSAVNNDAAAVAFTSVYLWVTLRLVQKGFSWLDFGILIAACLLMVLTKITAALALSVLPLTILFTFLRGRYKKLAWLTVLIGVGSLAVVSVRWDDAFGWYRSSSQPSSIRQKNSLAPDGDYVFSILNGAETTPPNFPDAFQHLPGDHGSRLAGKPVTFGFWIWSDQDQMVRSPVLRSAAASFSEDLLVSQEPTFYAFQAVMPMETRRIWVDLSPRSGVVGSYIYYDGLVLAEGQLPIAEPPDYSENGASAIEWGGGSIENHLRNGSAERVGPRIVPWLDNLAARFLPDGARPSMLLATLIDLEGSRSLYSTTAAHIFQTFWARFGWGNVPLFGGTIGYWVLFIFSFIGYIGFILHISQKRRMIGLDICLIFGMLVFQFALMALTRGGAYLALPDSYFSVARHLYPVILAFHLFLVIGWFELFSITARSSNQLSESETQKAGGDNKLETSIHLKGHMILYSLFLLFFNVLSIVSLIRYF